MKNRSILLIFIALLCHCDVSSAAHWPLDAVGDSGKVYGAAQTAPGVSGPGLALDGDSVIELENSEAIHPGSTGLSLSVWFNPYAPGRGQQVITGKNRYSRGDREWTLTIEPTGVLRAHFRQGGWVTISGTEPLQAGHWYRATMTIGNDKATLYLNGKRIGEAGLHQPIPKTKSPVTLGGIVDAGRLRQTFYGALDEVHIQSGILSREEIQSSYSPVTDTHEVPKPVLSETKLWDEREPLLPAAELPTIEGTRFSVIKPYEFSKDGYRFLHGVALCFHKGKWYSSFGHNKGGENTNTEEARWCVSHDEGKTWSEVKTIDDGTEPDIGVSHGSFLSFNGTLWAFQGAYRDTMKEVHTRAYRLDETTGEWQPQGIVINDGFWPMQQPIRMEDGNWIMAGLKVGKGNPAVVAISRGEDFTKWDVVEIPLANQTGKLWGESTVIVDGKQIMNISRYGAEARALVSVSEDFGRTWSRMSPGNLPMATSKPCAGLLSNGQRYLVCTTSADSGGRRAPLTIAVSRPGEPVFSKIFVIRRADFPEGSGESHPKASLSYPYAVEHQGKLYVGYSNDGGKVGRVGKGRELWNNNSAELAVIPIKNLR